MAIAFIPESLTAGTDVLGNVITNPRPNLKVLNFHGDVGNAPIPHDDSLNLTDDFTIEYWGNFYGVPTANTLVIQKGDHQIAYKLFNQSADRMFVRLREGGTEPLMQIPGLPDDFVCIQITRTGNVQNIYVNTVLANSGAVTGSITTNTDPIIMQSAAGMSLQEGSLKFYTKVLDADERLQNFEAQRTSYGI